MIKGCFKSSSNSSQQQVSSKESLITCSYQTRLFDSLIQLTLTWFKSPSSHTLTIHAPHFFTFTFSLYPFTLSLFGTRPKSKSIPLCIDNVRVKVKVYWDLTRAEFTHPNSAEPESRFYLALTCDGRVEFLLGDQHELLTRRLSQTRVVNSGESSLVSRREHVFGRKSYSTRAEFNGSTHQVEIECSGGALKVKIDGMIKMTVKRLAWKFRGNERIFIDGLGIEFYWDVFNWVNESGENHGVFIFQVGNGGSLPEIVGPEKRFMKKNSPEPVEVTALSPMGSSSSVLQWAEESSDCGQGSPGTSSTARSFGSSGGGWGGGFSLVLYAWRS